jgi:hypothetical protein
MVEYNKGKANDLGISRIQEVSLLANEASHAVDFVYNSLKFKRVDSELTACLVQGLLQRMLECMEEAYGVEPKSA